MHARIRRELVFGDFEGLSERQILKDLSEKGPEAIFNVFSGIFHGQNEGIATAIDKILADFSVSDMTLVEVQSYMHKVCEEVDEILFASKLFKIKGIKYILNHVQFRAFVFRILQMFKKVGMDVSSISPNDVPDSLGREIFNILRDRELTSLFIILKSYGVIKYSENIINDFERERELKILDVDFDDLVEDLEELGAKKVFEGEIQDLYFDYGNRRFDSDKKEERSFRIRKRIDIRKGTTDFYYTLKRKEKAVKGRKTRDAFEKEYKIIGFNQFFQIIEQFGLSPYRAKVKQRVSYSIDNEEEKKHIKFDIDSYAGIPTLLEIECDNEKTVEEYIQLLGLEENEILRTGSRGLFKRYNILSEYIFADTNRDFFNKFVRRFRKVT